MPIRKELYPTDWRRISNEVRAAADWRCQDCGARHLQIIRRTGRPEQQGQYLVDWEVVIEITETNGEKVLASSLSAKRRRFHGITKVIISTAHLDRDPGNNERENLGAKCQRCHFRYDMRQIVRSKQYGRNYDQQPQLFN
ncbi:MAG: hypothetical protein JNM22_05575 [Saprospiraceae bacterium]|nr:hypothetical protein [Saprospiraceae bacterium]